MQGSISIYIALLDYEKRGKKEETKEKCIYSVGLEPGHEPNEWLTPVMFPTEPVE